MKKGNFGINLSLIAVLCLAFAALGQSVAVLLICGYAILAEKNNWLKKYTVLTVVLMVINYLVNMVISAFFVQALGGLFRVADSFRLVNLMSNFSNILTFVVSLAFVVCYIILAINAVGGKELKISFLDKFFDKDEE